MRPGADSAEQLQIIEGAPALGKAAAGGERVLGAVSVAALFAVLVVASTSTIPMMLGCVVLLAALAVVIRWRWFHLRAPSRRLHTKVEDGVFFFALVTLAFPGLKLLWDNPSSPMAAVVASAIPSVLLACYLLLRWRR
ncbi:hypothetical protein ABZ383_00810 [Streptomyces sp. NPDC005900]|uniref:hypothetical protein n=1 Tax=Streptomyces sp. NPDC005900 TaxID=3154569 RepID=UPI0034103BF2